MPKTWIVAAVETSALLACCPALAADLKGSNVKILARGGWHGGWRSKDQPEQWTIRGRDDLADPRMKAPEHVIEAIRQRNAERLAKTLKVAGVDFEKHMVIGVSGGMKRTGGYRVEVIRIETNASKNEMTVHWIVYVPKLGQPLTRTITYPGEVVLVEKFVGEVRFEQETE